MENELIKTLIIDDEFPARKLLSEYVSKIPGLQLRGTCENAMKAMEIIQSEPIDLILTDIQMPDLSGLELVKSMADKPQTDLLPSFPASHQQGFGKNQGQEEGSRNNGRGITRQGGA